MGGLRPRGQAIQGRCSCSRCATAMLAKRCFCFAAFDAVLNCLPSLEHCARCISVTCRNEIRQRWCAACHLHRLHSAASLSHPLPLQLHAHLPLAVASLIRDCVAVIVMRLAFVSGGGGPSFSVDRSFNWSQQLQQRRQWQQWLVFRCTCALSCCYNRMINVTVYSCSVLCS